MKSRYAIEQIVTELKQVELGDNATDVCRKLGVSDATFFLWKKKYRGAGVSEVRRAKARQASRTARTCAASPPESH